MTTEPSLPPRAQTNEAEVSRRRFLRWAGSAGIGAATLGVLGGSLAACSSDSTTTAGSTTGDSSGSTIAGGAGKPITIGVIGPFSGFASFVGEVVDGSLNAAMGYLKDKQNGQYKGWTPTIKKYDATQAADGQKAYAQAIADKVDAILWCGAAGLVESLAQIVTDQVPVVSVFSDIQSYATASPDIPDLLTDKASGLPLFQTAMPDLYALSTLMTYCKLDRKYETVGLLYDKDLAPVEDKFFAGVAAKVGLKNQGTLSYSLLSGAPDFQGPIQKLRDAGCNAVFAWGLSDAVAGIAKTLVGFDAKYVDTPTAIASKFKPQLLGSPGGTGDASFVRKAGSAASRGTLTAWYIGGIVGLPSFPVRQWIKDYTPSYNGGVIKGGEDAPADGLACILTAADKAGSKKGADIIKALESGVETKFASPVGFSFGPKKHLSLTPDDIVLVSLQFPDASGGTEAQGFTLGKEWTDVFAKGYQGPTHLIDFTLENNRKVAPAVIDEILTGKYGTSCRPEYQSGDAQVAACKKVN